MADYIFTPSEYARKLFLDSGIDKKRIFKIPFGFDKNLFKPKAFYRKRDAFKILYAGSVTIRKGPQHLLQAFKELNLKGAKLTIIGGMADAENALKQYETYYTHIPFLHHEGLVKHYQEADIFVLPSLLDSFGMVVLEAMACGTPVIISENTGAKEAVRNGIDGFIIPIMDVEKLKEKVLFFYNNRLEIEKMGKNASKQAESYTWEKYRQRIREAVCVCLERKKG